ncbi:MAG: hypothetical protein ACRD2B_15880 [Terriglobia bacterium]
MFCCHELKDWAEQEVFFYGPKNRINDGRIVNEIETEYFIRSTASRGYRYIGINYCPFCGRALSTALWSAEKKK